MFIQAEMVSKYYGDLVVFRNLSVEVKTGEALAVRGPSGVGKTTLLKVLGTISKPSSGRILIDGVDVSMLNDKELTEFRRKIGFSFQEPVLLPYLTTLENVLLPVVAEHRAVDINKFEEKAIGILTKLGLEDRLNYLPTQLSAGQKKRVDLARAVIKEHQILIADEPTVHLDEESAQAVINILKKYANNQVLIFSTHSDEKLAAIAHNSIKIEKNVFCKECFEKRKTD